MKFDALLRQRSAADYADFLLPHLGPASLVLDAGCGAGTITVGLAPQVQRAIGVDVDTQAFVEAQHYAAQHGQTNVAFRAGSLYALPFADNLFDACVCHSVLEALDRPQAALLEIKRTLKAGGVLGAACVEYGGLLLGGPREVLLRRFYAIREQLWQVDANSDPYRGRALRGLLTAAGFECVAATSKYVCYGTAEAVQAFGTGRAADCRDVWYVQAAQHYGLATRDDLRRMEQAWLEWSESGAAYAAFAWCRALGWKPGG